MAQLNMQEVSFTIPICLSGNVDLSTRTFGFRVFYDDGHGPGNQGQFYLQSPDAAPPEPEPAPVVDVV